MIKLGLFVLLVALLFLSSGCVESGSQDSFDVINKNVITVIQNQVRINENLRVILDNQVVQEENLKILQNQCSCVGVE